MPWVFEPSADEQAALDEAEEELNAFLASRTIPERGLRGFGADRVAARPDANSALAIAWSDLVRNVGAPSLPVTVEVMGTIQRENPFSDHKFMLWLSG
jgi:hypothetical protein